MTSLALGSTHATTRGARNLALRGRLRAAVLGVFGVVVFLLLWEFGTQAHRGFGVTVPLIGQLPGPLTVVSELGSLAGSAGFWQSCWASFRRVTVGFLAALAVGVPLGLLMATRPNVKALLFPPFEVLRPIPPLAWVPLAIVFWPSDNVSIEFVIFLGAVYPVVLNIVGAAEQLDRRHLQVARSLGASGFGQFRRVIIPATLPSIVTGAVVGVGITWEVVVAAELIAGGGQSNTSGGIGFLLWNAYQGNQVPEVIVCMIALGAFGFASSATFRLAADRLMPWRRAR